MTDSDTGPEPGTTMTPDDDLDLRVAAGMSEQLRLSTEAGHPVPARMMLVYGELMSLHWGAQHDGLWSDCGRCHQALSIQNGET